MKAPLRWSLILAFASVYIIWGSTYLAIKIALESFPPLMLTAIRFVLAGTLVLAFTYPRYGKPITWRQWRSAFIVGTCLFLIANAGVVWSETQISSGLAALLVSTVPFWMIIVDWLRPGGHRPSWQIAVALVVGFIGIILLVGPDKILAGEETIKILPVIVLVFGSLSWAIGSVYSRQADLPSSPMVSTGMEMLCGGILLATASLLTGDLGSFQVSELRLDALAALIYLMTFGSIIGFSSYIFLLNNTSAALATTYAYVNPVVAMLLGWAFADEDLSVRTLIAAAIIIGSVVIITLYRQRPPSAPQADPEPAPLDTILPEGNLALCATGD